MGQGECCHVWFCRGLLELMYTAMRTYEYNTVEYRSDNFESRDRILDVNKRNSDTVKHSSYPYLKDGDRYKCNTNGLTIRVWRFSCWIFMNVTFIIKEIYTSLGEWQGKKNNGNVKKNGKLNLFSILINWKYSGGNQNVW